MAIIIILKKIVWLSVMWVAITLMFPSIMEAVPAPILGLSYVFAMALILTGRDSVAFLLA